MQAKLNAAIAALRQGVGAGADRARARRPSVLARVLAGECASGDEKVTVMISSVHADSFVESPGAARAHVRKARMRDIPPILL